MHISGTTHTLKTKHSYKEKNKAFTIIKPTTSTHKPRSYHRTAANEMWEMLQYLFVTIATNAFWLAKIVYPLLYLRKTSLLPAGMAETAVGAATVWVVIVHMSQPRMQSCMHMLVCLYAHVLVLVSWLHVCCCWLLRSSLVSYSVFWASSQIVLRPYFILQNVDAITDADASWGEQGGRLGRMSGFRKGKQGE